MKKNTKVAAVNMATYALVLSPLVLAFFDETPSFHRGQAKGALIGIVIVLLVYAYLTLRFTRSSGGSWQQVRLNLRRNFSMLAITRWWRHRR